MKKKLAIILSVFAFLGFIAIIGSVVFKVQYVTVTFANQQEAVNQVEVKTQLEAYAKSKIKDKSIFVVNQETLKKDLESVNLRVRATNVEFVFPSRVKITVRERYAVYYYRSGGDYYILDSTLHVITDALNFSQFTAYNNNLIGDVAEIKGDFAVPTDFIKGSILDIGSENKLALQGVSLYYDAMKLNEDAMRERIVSVTFADSKLHLQTNYATEIIIEEPHNKMITKISIAYTALSQTNPKPSTIWVYADETTHAL